MSAKQDKPRWVRLFPSDFLGGSALMSGKQRSIYAYLLILQADQGAIKMNIKELAMHLQVSETDVSSVLDIKFDFNADINGWVNSKMAEELERSGRIWDNKKAGAAKARSKKAHSKKREELELELDSDIKVDINVDINEPTKAKKFQRPTIEEISAYGQTLKPPFSNAAKFFDFYESKGWKVGRTPMKDWKATVRNWNRKDLEEGQPRKQTATSVDQYGI